MPRNARLISKSKYLAALQCDKLLWHHYNRKHLIPRPDAALQAVFDHGHRIGELARRLFPDGIEVATGVIDPFAVDAESRRKIQLRRPLFEAGFISGIGFARADVLVPGGETAWDIVEVKSGDRVKEVNLHDLSLQWYVYRGAGLELNRAFIMFVENSRVQKGDPDPAQMFAREDVTDRIDELLPSVGLKLEQALKVIDMPDCPEMSLGQQCLKPYKCPLINVCSKALSATPRGMAEGQEL